MGRRPWAPLSRDGRRRNAARVYASSSGLAVDTAFENGVIAVAGAVIGDRAARRAVRSGRVMAVSHAEGSPKRAFLLVYGIGVVATTFLSMGGIGHSDGAGSVPAGVAGGWAVTAGEF